MKITFDWLKDHLSTNLKEEKLLELLTNIGLEVESVENLSLGNELFKVAKIVNTEKHPNADRLIVCDVNVGEKDLKKVVCGANNARDGLITIYATPGAIIPKTKIKLVANMEAAAGILLQKLPQQTPNEQCSQDWIEKSMLLETLRKEEQIKLSHNDQLTSLFPNDAVRILSIKNPNFCCSCLIGPTNRKTVCQAGCIR